VAKNIPFEYYGEGWNLYVTDPTESNTFDRYCNICNPFLYETQFMGTLATREKYIADTTQLYEEHRRHNGRTSVSPHSGPGHILHHRRGTLTENVCLLPTG
jgi:hypothetical protein